MKTEISSFYYFYYCSYTITDYIFLSIISCKLLINRKNIILIYIFKTSISEDIVVIEKSDLYEPPKFIKPLLPMCAPEGEPLEIIVEATGTPLPVMQW